MTDQTAFGWTVADQPAPLPPGSDAAWLVRVAEGRERYLRVLTSQF